MFGLVSLNQNKVVTYMLINLYLVCLETSPPFIHRKSGRSAQEGKGAGCRQCTSLLWWRGSWDWKRSCRLTGQSTFHCHVWYKELQRVAWLFLRHTLRSFWWVLLLHFAGGSPLRWFVHLTARPPECPLYEVLGHNQLEGNPKAHPRKAERTTVCFLAGLGTPQCLQKTWRRWLEKEAWESLLRLWPLQPRLAAENGWIDEICHISAKMGISQGIS